MNPAHDELCHAIIVVGAEWTEGGVEPESLHRLAELGMAQWNEGAWELTVAGLKLLPPLLDGQEIPALA